MLIQLERIEVAGPDKRARRLFLSGQDEPRMTSASVVRALGLEEGSQHSRDDFMSALENAEDDCARERAMKIVGYRERSARELERRLADDGFPAGVARSTVARFVELGLVDDERFAGMWARSRAAAGFGPRRALDELARRGVAPLIAAAAVSEAFGEEDRAMDRARAALRGRRPADKRDRERLIRRLVGRGFGLSVAIAAVDESADIDDETGL